MRRRAIMRLGILMTCMSGLPYARAGSAPAYEDEPGANYWSTELRGDRPSKLLQLDGPGYRAGAVAFSADGSTVAIGSDDGFIRVYNAVSGRELRAIRAQAAAGTVPIHAVAFSPNGRMIAAAAPEGAAGSTPRAIWQHLLVER